MKFQQRAVLTALFGLSSVAGTIGAQAATSPTTGAPAVAAAPAVTAAPVLPALSAQQIVEKNLAARGGSTAWRSIQSVVYSGSLDAGRVRPDNGIHPSTTERLIDKPGKSTKPGQAPDQHLSGNDAGTPVSLPYTLYMKRPGKQRVEVKFKDETLIQVYDGKTGWKLQPYLHRGVLPFTAEEIKKARQFQDIDGPLFDYAAKGSKVELDGTELVDGSAAYRLKLTLKSGDVRHIWIDAASFLDVQIDGVRRLNGHEVAQYTAMSDFRSVDGVKLPFLMDTRTAGLPDHEKIVVEKATLNPKIDDKLFGKPNQ
jgi:hypothetical protein